VCVHPQFIQFCSRILFLCLRVFLVLHRFQNNVPLQSALLFHQLLINVQLCVCNMFSKNINVTIFIGLVLQLTIMYILDSVSGLFSLLRIWDTIRTLSFQFCCKQSLQKPSLILVTVINLIAVKTDATTSNCMFHDVFSSFFFVQVSNPKVNLNYVVW
jgi:hypothetical protein